MNLNDTPSPDRIHIGIFGRRNAGKSSVINRITGQSLAIVSDKPGTTTDPVSKAMELLPLGPVIMVDTPGLDDEGELGALRIQKAYEILNKTDIAVLVVDGCAGVTKEDLKILKQINSKHIPCVVAFNKADLTAGTGGPFINTENPIPNLSGIPDENVIAVSSVTGEHIKELKELIARQNPKEANGRKIVGDLLQPHDLVVLVVPIDKAAPKGRLILPQQQTIRDLLDSCCAALVVKESELKETLAQLGKKPALVITDSQVFAQVSAIVPPTIPLTSFSILFARYKGSLKTLAEGAKILEELKDGDRILISEGCTHHRQCEDIGTVKLPRMLLKHTGKRLEFEFSSGNEFPQDLSGRRLVIHCGGCMLNEREMKHRLLCAKSQNIPVTNYGIAIAHMQGILKRSLEVFPDLDKPAHLVVY